MNKFVVTGVGRSGTTALTSSINLHPRLFCATELFDGGMDHAGLFERMAECFREGYFLHEYNAATFAPKNKDRLVAVGNKQPQYFLTWDRTLKQIGSPSAVAVFRRPADVMSSWKVRRQAGDGHWPRYLLPALVPFDMLEALSRFTKSDFADRTLLLSYARFFQSEEAAGLYERVVSHLGAAPDGEATGKFMGSFVHIGGEARPGILSPGEQDLAAAFPLDDFLDALDARGAATASDMRPLAASTVARAKDMGEELFGLFERCFDADRLGFADLDIVVRGRLQMNGRSLFVALARRAKGPAASAVVGLVCFLRKDFAEAVARLKEAEARFGGEPAFEAVLNIAAGRLAAGAPGKRSPKS